MEYKFNIAHLQLLPMMSGVQQVSVQELTRLSDDCYEKMIVCKEGGALSEVLSQQGVEARFVGDLQRSIHPIRDWKALWGLRDLFRREGCDVVHTHSSKTGFLGRLAARLAGVPCIVHTVHGFAFPAAKSKFEYFVYWVLEWVAGRCCDAVIVLTESDRQICVQSLGLSAEKVRLIPNGVDTDKYLPVSESEKRGLRGEKFGVSDDTVVAVMVGRLWEQKAPEVLVEAAMRIFQQNPDVKLQVNLVGVGELRGELEHRVTEAGLEQSIQFLGWRSDVPELLQAADIFVLPSRWEGLSLAILEAMACRVAVVASDIPGNRAALDDGKCGVLFPLEDVDALAEQLGRLSRSLSEREEWAQRGVDRVMHAHLLSQRIQRVDALYCELLK